MRAFRKHKFEIDELKLGPGIYTDYNFDHCTFSYVPFAYPRLPEDRALVRNVHLVNSDVEGPDMQAIIAEHCVVENLKTHGSFWIYGAVFKHVVLRGRFGRLMFTEWSPGSDEEERAPFKRADEAYYEHVDWALDVSEAEFYSFDFRYVPGHLVRRDPDTQVLIWRDTLFRHDWNRLDFPVSGYDIALKLFAESKLPSVVLVAGKRHPKFKLLLEQLKQLRDLGIAEPD